MSVLIRNEKIAKCSLAENLSRCSLNYVMKKKVTDPAALSSTDRSEVRVRQSSEAQRRQASHPPKFLKH